MANDTLLNALALPGWENQASEFVYLVQQLANSSNASIVPQIEKQIQHLQRESTGWLIGFFALSHDDPHVRFYGALTLTIKINSQWESLSVVEGGSSTVLDSLRSRYIHLANASDHAIVLRKVASSLTAYCLQPTTEWKYPVRDLLLHFVHNDGGSGTSAGSISEIWRSINHVTFPCLRSLLWFCSTWVEEAHKFDSKTVAGSKVYEKAAKNQEDVWCLIHCILRSICSRSGSTAPGDQVRNEPLRDLSDEQLVEVSKEAINTSLSWTKVIDSLPPSESALIDQMQRETVQMISQCFWVAPLADSILEYLSFVVESAPSFHHFLPSDTLKKIIQSDQVGAWLKSLESEGDAPEGVRIATFIDALVDLEDLSSPQWVHNGSLNHIIPILHAFLNVPGVPGVENAVASISLDIWTRIADGLNDWVGSDDADVVVITELQKVIVEASPKMRLPEEELNGHDIWDQDERVKFSAFRQDYDDYLLACHTSTAEFVVNFVYQNVVAAMAGNDWSLFESTAYSLGTLSEVISNNEGRDWVYQGVYQSPTWHSICIGQLSIPVKAGQGVVNLIAASTKFLQCHREYLIPCLQYLFSGLSDGDQSSLASEAIQTLCDSRRSDLTSALPQLLSSLSVLDQMHPAHQRRIFFSLAAIIQALLSEEAKVQPLKDLLQILFQQGGRLEEMRRQQDEDTLSAAAAFLRNLAGIGRGLRAPEENVIALDESKSEQSDFWISGPGAEVQNMILQALTQILQSFPSNDTTAAACEVLKAGYTEKDPFAFRFSPSVNGQFLVPLIQKDTPDIEQILSTTTAFFASHAWSADAVRAEFDRTVVAICGVHRQLLDDHAVGRTWTDQEFSYSSLDLLDSLLLRYCDLLLAVGTAPAGTPILPTIFEFALHCLRNPDILPRKSATKFWATAFDLSGYNSRLGPEISFKWDKALEPIIPHFATIILQLIAGECARSEIDVISLPLRRFVEKKYSAARGLLKTLIDDPNVLPSSAQANVTGTVRQAFVQKVLTLRGIKKTDSVVREFWIACRGSNFAYTS